jgi:hypothetical protein
MGADYEAREPWFADDAEDAEAGEEAKSEQE